MVTWAASLPPVTTASNFTWIATNYPSRHAPADAHQHRDAGAASLEQLNAKLKDSLFLFGRHASLADMAIAPFIRQFAQTDPAWFDQQDWPSPQQCLSGLLASTLFHQVMHKYAPWQAGSRGMVFPGTPQMLLNI